MENASKALIIAGEILIGMMIIGILAFLLLNLGETATTYDTQMSETEIAKFNSYFTKFGAREDITPAEVVSVINYAEEYNKEAGREIIEVSVPGYTRGGSTIEYMQSAEDKTYYKCNVTYNEDTGMVSKVTFRIP